MLIRRSQDLVNGAPESPSEWRKHRPRGFTLIELLLVLAVSVILAAIAVPMMSRALASVRLNSAISQLSAAISSTRFQAIKDSQIYTLVLTTPANTYVVTNTGASPAVASPAVALPAGVSFGASGTYTFTLCPNGMVYGSGGCPNANAPPSFTATYQQSEVTMSVSGVGNVTTTKIR